MPRTSRPHAKELKVISRVLDANPAMAKAVAEDLVRDVKNPENGARGMSGDQALRVAALEADERGSATRSFTST